MSKTGFTRADILVPKAELLEKWCTVACDQFTSEPEYWDEVIKIIENKPSAFNITFPEIYLEDGDAFERIISINDTMQRYLNEGLFREYKNRYIYIERKLFESGVRAGIIGAIDLEMYDFSKGSQSLVRATEDTVVERIPPRVKIRKNAPIESPHIMMLIDDEKGTVIEPLAKKKTAMTNIYDNVELMRQGGKISGWLINDKDADRIDAALEALADRAAFEKKYGAPDKGTLLFAMGDGNHSLATAKQCYEDLKAEIGEEAAKAHPARFALVELVNLHSPALTFKPIHRAAFDVDVDKLIAEMTEELGLVEGKVEGMQSFVYFKKRKDYVVSITKPTSEITVGSLQNFLDGYLKRNGGKIDYIHGKFVAIAHSRKDENISFVLPDVYKSDLFPTVIKDGALPRKTFSMGNAWDKRYYLECRKIK